MSSNPFKSYSNTQQRIQTSKINIDVSSINEFPEMTTTIRPKIETSSLAKANYAETTKKVQDITSSNSTLSTEKEVKPGWTQLNYDNSTGKFLMVQSPEIISNKEYTQRMDAIHNCNIQLQNMVDRWTNYLENFIEMHGEELYLRTYTDYYNSEYYEFEESIEDNDEYYYDNDVNADTDDYDGYYD